MKNTVGVCCVCNKQDPVEPQMYEWQQLRLIDFGNPLGNVSAPAGANWRTLLGQD
ncbi:hypothetical protein [Methylomonas sp. TEB]|uniref:hypothetical protein n=1 Tax=Methylomonas sp. TEB TaxID=3398229 RepID=UPI0039F51F3D